MYDEKDGYKALGTLIICLRFEMERYGNFFGEEQEEEEQKKDEEMARNK